MSNGILRTLVVAGPLLAALLSGCGIKNLPQAPGRDQAPAAAVEPQIGSNPELIGAQDQSVGALTGPRIATTGDDDEQVTAAEVVRTQGARNESFFLDSLLN